MLKSTYYLDNALQHCLWG